VFHCSFLLIRTPFGAGTSVAAPSVLSKVLSTAGSALTRLVEPSDKTTPESERQLRDQLQQALQQRASRPHTSSLGSADSSRAFVPIFSAASLVLIVCVIKRVIVDAESSPRKDHRLSAFLGDGSDGRDSASPAPPVPSEVYAGGTDVTGKKDRKKKDKAAKRSKDAKKSAKKSSKRDKAEGGAAAASTSAVNSGRSEKARVRNSRVAGSSSESSEPESDSGSDSETVHAAALASRLAMLHGTG
jgi:hypothetical protein